MRNNLSGELKELFNYTICLIKDNHDKTPNISTFVLCLLKQKTNLAYKVIESITTEEVIDNLITLLDKGTKISENKQTITFKKYLKLFNDYIEESCSFCDDNNISSVNSSVLLYSIVKGEDQIRSIFNNNNITIQDIKNVILNKANTNNKEQVTSKPIRPLKQQKVSFGEYDKVISKIELNGNVISQRHLSYYDTMIPILSRSMNNNIALVGEHGVGKSYLIHSMANILNSNEYSYEYLKDKELIKIDIIELCLGVHMRGEVELRLQQVINFIVSSCKEYVIFIENFDMFVERFIDSEHVDVWALSKYLFKNKNFQVICELTPKNYSAILDFEALENTLNEVFIDEPTGDILKDILTLEQSKISDYHNVQFENKCINTITSNSLDYNCDIFSPLREIRILDEIASSFCNTRSNNSSELYEKLEYIKSEIKELEKKPSTKNYNKIDKLTIDKLSLETEIRKLSKDNKLNGKYIISNAHVIDYFNKSKTDKTSELNQNIVRDLLSNLKSNVIGQDEAIETITKVIKRRHVGLSQKDKPDVFMFLGSTGLGKTHLAKQLAINLYGSEDKLVRVNMNEFSDDTSVNKLIGANPGYIGYGEDMPIITALKKGDKFILLLDEFEKCSGKVINTFLQLFDEGLFTDATGKTYKMNDGIIILTSNIGIHKANMRGSEIGFVTNNEDLTNSIINKELTKKFPPELLSRINKIIYFNKLTDNDLSKIITIKFKDLKNRLIDIGYDLSDDFISDKSINFVLSKIDRKTNEGARSIRYIIESYIEDKIVDLIIDSVLDKGHKFTFDEVIT